MRKPKLTKAVFIAAFVCTVLCVKLIVAGIVLQDIYVLNVSAVFAIICFLLWEFHYSMTHDCLGRKFDFGNKNISASNSKSEQPKSRFVFSEDTVREKMGKIAEHFKLKMKCKITWDEFYLPIYHIVLAGKYNFKITISHCEISIYAPSLTSYSRLNDDTYCYCNYFQLLDDSLDSFKAQRFTELVGGCEDIGFSSNIFFDNLSDDEIFSIIEKIMDALYGAASMKYETVESDNGKESFIFYLDAPDYYGYTETVTIGNFKFIINGGLENG
ncbi:MAG: hypothetical protein J6C96_07275 [Oscillospiraceae bacterium]|nr:hypothetical protein [Oscillospiraceae bacterium]